MTRRTTSISDRNIYELEAHLAGTLRPLAPPQDLTQRLRDRARWPEPRALAQRIVSWRFFFVVIGGAISAGLVVLTLARALFNLTGRSRDE